MQQLCHHIYNLIRILSAGRRSVTHPGPGSQLSAIYCLLHYRSDHPSAIWAGSADHTMITARLIAQSSGSLSHQHNLMRAAAATSPLLGVKMFRNSQSFRENPISSNPLNLI